LSSAEDVTSSPASPRTESSDSGPEEFRVEPHSGESGDQHSASSPPQDAPPVELVDSAPSEQPDAAPEEDNAAEPKRKPLPKVTAIAKEVRVRATGARPGTVLGERELFTESTTTALIFEKGAILRLSAAVAPGQLLYLTNEESNREVVAQVVRKRAFRPTECYVEVEFTEPAPGFWGVTFSAATALLPKDAKEAAAAEMVASAETTADELAETAPVPSAEEVQALKKDVDALRKQLGMPQAPESSNPPEPVPSAPDLPVPATSTPAPQTPAPAYEHRPAADIGHISESFPVDGEHDPIAMAIEQHEKALEPAMDFHISLPKPKRSFRARGQFTPGFRAGMLRVALLSVTLAALIGLAWYKQRLPWMHPSQKIAVSSLAGGVTSAAPLSAPQPASPAAAETPAPIANVSPGKDAPPPASPAATPQGANSSSETEREAPAENGTANSISVVESPTRSAPKTKPGPSASIAKQPAARPTVKPTEAVASSLQQADFVPPKLLRAVRAVASLDDLRDFETGSVVVDAVVDASGTVTSMSVLSGPPSLRRPATEALKNYKYEPATLHGRSVPAHVTVKIQFRFE